MIKSFAMKCLLILFLAVPVYSQTVSYDKFKDTTLISTDSVRVNDVYMAVKATHKGEKVGDVHYYMVFTSTSSSWLFLRSHELIFLVDGERINLGDGSHIGRVRSSRYSSGVAETMIYTIPRADLERIVKAKSVELKLGYMEAVVKDKKGMVEILSYGR